MSGYIFDHRKELDSDIWLLPPMYHRVWQWIKYKVNHAEAKIPNRDGTFTTIKPGQHATSYRMIAKGVGYYEGLKWKEPNPKTIKTILNWLECQKMITVKGNTNGTVITVENWAVYQTEVVNGNTKETLKKHSLDTNNNDKEEIIINNIYIEPLVKLWNSKDQLSNHKTTSKSIYEAIEANILTDDDYEKAKQGIEIYYAAFIDSTFYYSHSFKLGAFISQDNGFRDWCSGGIRYNEFKLHKDKSKNKKSDAKPKNQFHNFDQRDTSGIDVNAKFGINGVGVKK